jgi:hypothetical protein
MHSVRKMLIAREGAHAFYVSIFGGVEHLRWDVQEEPGSGHPTSPLQWRRSATCGDAFRHIA